MIILVCASSCCVSVKSVSAKLNKKSSLFESQWQYSSMKVLIILRTLFLNLLLETGLPFYVVI